MPLSPREPENKPKRIPLRLKFTFVGALIGAFLLASGYYNILFNIDPGEVTLSTIEFGHVVLFLLFAIAGAIAGGLATYIIAMLVIEAGDKK